ncbi:MAG: GNAT family N-acetyltransferase, partial [Solirubrobacteraceae bacterium]
MTAGEPHSGVVLRPARAADAETLRGWRNDPTAVRFSASARPVSEAEHSHWMLARLADPHTRMWVAEEAGMSVGQVRVELDGGSGVVSIAVDTRARGRRVGSAILAAMIDQMTQEGGISRLTALVHAENLASLRSFE